MLCFLHSRLLVGIDGSRLIGILRGARDLLGSLGYPQLLPSRRQLGDAARRRSSSDMGNPCKLLGQGKPLPDRLTAARPPVRVCYRLPPLPTREDVT
jgi:hypothetical protein